ncbi:MAG: hypothetical protein LIO71_04495 [Ruminococcus sp.]|nr:hypothetical protein [Ruminococcus sp.]
MNENKRTSGNKEVITLGSGYLHYIMATTDYDDEVALKNALFTDDNILGYIQGGATLEYKPTFYDAKDDLGILIKSAITDETATLKSGVCSWNGETLNVLTETASSVTENTGYKYNIDSYWEHLVADYSGLNIFEVENVNIVDYLQLRRDAFIYKMNQTKDGQEYLNKA